MGSESGSTPLDAAGGAEEVVATVVVEAGLREEANEAALIIDLDLPTVEVDFAVDVELVGWCLCGGLQLYGRGSFGLPPRQTL